MSQSPVRTGCLHTPSMSQSPVLTGCLHSVNTPLWVSHLSGQAVYTVSTHLYESITCQDTLSTQCQHTSMSQSPVIAAQAVNAPSMSQSPVRTGCLHTPSMSQSPVRTGCLHSVNTPLWVSHLSGQAVYTMSTHLYESITCQDRLSTQCQHTSMSQSPVRTGCLHNVNTPLWVNHLSGQAVYTVSTHLYELVTCHNSTGCQHTSMSQSPVIIH